MTTSIDLHLDDATRIQTICSPIFITVRTVYRETPLTVTSRLDGTVLSVATTHGDSVTSLLTDAQLTELAAMVRGME